MRLIDADALKKAFEDIQEVSECGKYVTDEMFDLIDNAPAISPYKAIHDELHKEE